MMGATITAGVQKTRWVLTGKTVDWSGAGKIVLGDKFALYMKNTRFTGNLETGNSTSFNSGANIRIDKQGDNNVLNGTLTLRDGETTAINLMNTGGIRVETCFSTRTCPTWWSSCRWLTA